LSPFFQEDMVFSVVTSCNYVTEYQRFGGPCCLHLQEKVTVGWYPTTSLHGVTIQKNLLRIFTVVET